MLIGLTHVALSAAATVGCVVWWRQISRDALVRTVLAAGLILRAVIGLMLFAISDAHLPLGRSLQLEPGFWFFGSDGLVYYYVASHAASQGLHGLLAIPASTPSVFYVRLLAVALDVFGMTPATSLLVNLWAFAALATIVLEWGRRVGAGRASLVVSLAATSLTPSWILWSFQPLKDGVFLLVIGLFFFAADRWYARLAAAAWSWWAVAGLLVAQVVLIYALAGIRWYYAAVAVALMPIGLLALFIRRPHLSLARAGLALGGCLLLAETLVTAAGPDLPVWLVAALRPHSVQALWLWQDSPDLAGRTLRKTLEGNVEAGGSTLMRIAPDARNPAGRNVSDASPTERLRATLAALSLPKILAQPVGHVTIGGDRGLWAFADLDTLAFEATILACIWVLAGQLRGGATIRPVFWHLLAATAAITLLLGSEVANFGTLFRMRSMTDVGIALLPLAAAKGAAVTPARDTPPSRY